jgi:hypothetical protein
MGTDLPKRTGGKAPTFMVYARRDPIGANLDCIQVVKGWLDADGETYERVYDAAWSGDHNPAKDGKLPPQVLWVILVLVSVALESATPMKSGPLTWSYTSSVAATTTCCGRCPPKAIDVWGCT